MNQTTQKCLETIYKKLFERFGPQSWWPAETKFEVIIGAILTQNTNWGNVEKALVNLKQARVLNPFALRQISISKLARLIKPSGTFNIKAKRLKNFIRFFYKEYGGDLGMMAREPLDFLRKKILAVDGIGPETADSILLYACDHPVFVVDAYTKRIFFRHHLVREEADYYQIQKIFMSHLPADAQLFNEHHALIVRLGKDFCRTKPLCELCPLNYLNRSEKYRYSPSV